MKKLIIILTILLSSCLEEEESPNMPKVERDTCFKSELHNGQWILVEKPCIKN